MDKDIFELILQTYCFAADFNDSELQSTAREGLINIINQVAFPSLTQDGAPIDKTIADALKDICHKENQND